MLQRLVQSASPALQRAASAISIAGQSAEETAVLFIGGMTCASCVGSVEKQLLGLSGVRDVSVSLMGKRGQVSYEPGQVTVEQLVGAVRELGFESNEVDSTKMSAPGSSDEAAAYRAGFLGSLVFSFPAFLIAMVLPHTPFEAVLEITIRPGLQLGLLLLWICSSCVQFGYAGRFYKRARAALAHGNSNMDVLVSLSTTVAYAYSTFVVFGRLCRCAAHHSACPSKEWMGQTCFETSAMLISFMLLGKYLEESAKGKASEAVSKLVALQPPYALRCLDGPTDKTPKEVLVSELNEGDCVMVLPGTILPADGKVIAGESAVDESMITGEAVPISKQIGSAVVGGTYNGPGVLWVAVRAVGADSALSKIMNLVAAAQTRKPKMQAFADKVAGLFVPCTVTLAMLTGALWLSAGWYGLVTHSMLQAAGYGSATFLAFSFSISVLVIACPCALGLATPTAVMVGSGVGARQGILFKGGDVMETAAKLSAVVFDKTGTLTHGTLSVTSVASFVPSLSQEHLLAMIAAAESFSNHPLARSVCAYAKEQGVPSLAVANLKSSSGHGLSCLVDGSLLVLGNRAWLAKHAITPTAAQEKTAQALEVSGHTVMLAAVGGQLSGMVALSDVVKREAAAVIEQLQSMDIQVWMVSGDNERTVRHVADSLGIRNWRGGTKPEEKVAQLRELQGKGHVVAMVGDGTNDAPALAQADVGLAVGSGTEVAIEAADIVLIKSSLRDVATAIDLSQTVMNRIRFNFLWATGYNIVGVPLASGLFFPIFKIALPPVFAGAAMALSSVSVVCSSLVLRFYRPPSLPADKADLDILVKA